MRTWPKINTKILSKISSNLNPPARVIASARGPCRDGLLAWYRGVKTNDLKLYDSVGQFEGMPIPAQGWEGDGVRYVKLQDAISFPLTGDWEVYFGCHSDTDTQICGVEGSNANSIMLNALPSPTVQFWPSTGAVLTFTWPGLSMGESHEFKIVQSSGTIRAYMDDDEIEATESYSAYTGSEVMEPTRLARANITSLATGNSIWGLRFYNSSGEESLYCPCLYAADSKIPILINNQVSIALLIGTYAGFNVDYYDGLTGFNPNVMGYTVATGPITQDNGTIIPTAAGTLVPADTDPVYNDITGLGLQYQGDFKLHMLYHGNAALFDGTIKVTGPWLGTESVTSSVGTAVPTVGVGEITFTAGWCCEVILDDGTHLILESHETSTQTDVFDVSGNGNHGVITGGAPPYFTSQQADATWLGKYGWNESGGTYAPAAIGADAPVIGTFTATPHSLHSTEPGHLQMPHDKRLHNADLQPQVGEDELGDPEVKVPIEFFFETDGTPKWIKYEDIFPTALGDNITRNGTFDSDTIWSKNANVSISGGEAHCTLADAQQHLYQQHNLVAGKTYNIKMDVTANTGEVAIRFYVDGAFVDQPGSLTGGATGTIDITVEYPALGNGYLYIVWKQSVGSVDNVEVREVIGNGLTINNQYTIRIDQQKENTKEMLIYKAPLIGACLYKTYDHGDLPVLIVDDDYITFMTDDDDDTTYSDN